MTLQGRAIDHRSKQMAASDSLTAKTFPVESRHDITASKGMKVQVLSGFLSAYCRK